MWWSTQYFNEAMLGIPGLAQEPHPNPYPYPYPNPNPNPNPSVPTTSYLGRVERELCRGVLHQWLLLE